MYRIARSLGHRHYSNQSLQSLIDVKSDIQDALNARGPVVALESTIITHGMPYPQNLETAIEVENIVRQHVNYDSTLATIQIDHVKSLFSFPCIFRMQYQPL